ncbi:hypothetical protein OG322_34630 [Streptomyces sp. NBC_01260]|uniref:Uncharacterized protein n=1 Tax=Streptomyces laculatispora TaxID=887464 RepID=A0ABY9IEF3_9ACTN|nr:MULTISPECIES: hypothetical protein [Streptomyces]MBO0914391.1 hypothetical protein [Streptomyces laculatispora]ROQ73150.1 hypothetical protein EDD95_5801 [Streptomyces sp. CEV 2-1]RPK35990.1 hypothetical protein EES39_32515 [Streptomyces sp. ADI92-24]WLQ44594.1 hypothetical protein P8A22_34650 [Streptomyces laculatispora]
MGKKQSRHNRGARSGGHEHSAATTTEPKEQTSTAPTPEGVEAISEHVSHKRERKFGHN